LDVLYNGAVTLLIEEGTDLIIYIPDNFVEHNLK
jgi:hypothetical protein